MTDHKSRIQEARRKLRIRQSVAQVLDTTLTNGARHLKMCGEGPKHSWSILFAELWFTDCPCCLFYRGAVFGFAVAGLIAGVAASVLFLTGVF